MKEGLNTEELKEAARETYRQLQNELEKKKEEAEEVKIQMRVVEATQGLLDEIDRLNSDNEALQKEIDGLNQQLQDKDTQLKELGKLSAGVAKKSSADDVAKAIRIYLNTSKRKTQSKREAAKTVLLELITAAKLEMSEDIMESLSHFDDEELTEQSQAEKLQIKKKWKLFQQLWGIPNMAQLAGSWQQTGKLPPRSSEIDDLME